MARIEVNGLNDLSASLQRFGQQSKKFSDEVLKEGAEEFIRYAQAIVPVDEGNLRNSIKILNESDFGQGSAIRIGVDLGHRPGTRAYITGTVADYAQRVHDDAKFIDATIQHMKTWMIKRTQSAMNKVIGGIFGSVKGFFNRFF